MMPLPLSWRLSRHWSTKYSRKYVAECLPQFVLHQGCSSPAVVGLQPAKLLVAAVVLLNEHGSPPALLELLLFVVAAEFTLDKDGGLRHLLIKCILPTRTKQYFMLCCV